MFRTFVNRLGFVCASLAWLGAIQSTGAAPPYEIVLRTRGSVVTPERTRDAQTGGGFIQVTQVEPNAVMFVMRGAAACGAGHKDGSAGLQFDLNQDFEVVPTRAGLRPPRLILSAWAIGSLQSTLVGGGTAEQAAACATVNSAGQPILNVCIQPHSVAAGQNLFVNDRVGPMEMPVLPGGYCFHQTFALSVHQPKNHCHPGTSAADFDPDPKLDAHWNEVLKPFRAVPHRDFGFRAILQVVEEPLVPGAPVPGPDVLPAPTPEQKKAAAAGKVARP